jgi:hypothetical protein
MKAAAPVPFALHRLPEWLAQQWPKLSQQQQTLVLTIVDLLIETAKAKSRRTEKAMILQFRLAGRE